MNKRQRKKYLKKKGLYISNAELWNLDLTICNWIIPRLRQFKKINIAYPGKAPMDTPEKWDEALDKMILSFDLLRNDPIDLYDDLFDKDYEGEFIPAVQQYWATVQEGLDLFAKWFSYLWI